MFLVGSDKMITLSSSYLILWSVFVSYATSDYTPSLGDNLQFLMFENFDLNRQNFIDELQIVKTAKVFKNSLSAWQEYLKRNLDNFQARRLDPQLPISSFGMLRRYLQYTSAVAQELDGFYKVQISVMTVVEFCGEVGELQ